VPETLIIMGAQKSASTSVTKWFADIPGVELLSWECVAFEGRAHELRTRHLRAQVARVGARGLVPALHRPEIFHNPVLCRRAAAACKGAVTVTVLRHPVDRAVSAWWHYRRLGAFAPTLRLRDCAAVWRRSGNHSAAGQVVAYSVYSPAVGVVKELFPSACIAFNEDVLSDPPSAFAAVTASLGLPPGGETLPRVNTRGDVDSRAGVLPAKLIGLLGFRWDRLEEHLAPRALGWRAMAVASRAAAAVGVGSSSGDEEGRVEPADREAVLEAVVSDLDRLEEALGRPVPATWRSC
jgi:hypothetical protein